MMAQLDLPYDFALIPCTRNKDRQATTAWRLYAASPRFRLMYAHAQQRCPQIVIMSALYGLIRPEAEASYYDAYLPDLDYAGRQSLAGKMEQQLKTLPPIVRVLSYLPLAYHEFLQKQVGIPAGWNVRRPYAGLDMFKHAQVLKLECLYFNRHPSRRG